MNNIINTTEYTELTNAVHAIKGAILQSQQRALAAINQEQLALYYGIGRFISANTRNKNWGKGFIEAISEQLRKELPGLRGFSAASLRKMRTFYEEWQMLSDNSFVETNKLVCDEQNSFVGTNELPIVQFKIDAHFPITAFMNIGFTHHYAIISKVKDVEQRKFYIQLAADTKAKVEDLELMINDDLYNHQGKLPNNFKKTIPDQLQAYRAITMFKDEYLLDFINTEELFIRDKDRDEKVIEQSIVQNVKEFIMTFGKDFAFVGNQYHLEKFGVEEFPDLLFFNRELAALVCVELKDGPFKTSYLGQLAAYLRILDDEVRKPNENPSIGIILCKSANKKFVEYVIQDYGKPMGVATYKTTADMDERLKNLLPPVEELEKLL
ncbi:PDDEXK nuclease domain-containing protein [Bacteroides salyersiae]|mgnify:FL=1|jgi:predicted nuclease of restriction endonuclease-like (RecB) superfamily|uniref:PDDEXK nuclease domain-containing protein n=1 Tax=Bacteroides salyersiae TaxID=291644 RepID=UPI001C8B430F|nr:PDDEXK nuclease domain-containing protein [Bacteroides salyersiae]